MAPGDTTAPAPAAAARESGESAGQGQETGAGQEADPGQEAGEAKEPVPASDAAAPAGASAATEQAGEDAIEAMEEVGGTIAPSGGAATAKTGSQAAAAAGREAAADGGAYERPVPPTGVRSMGSLDAPGRATVEGRVYAVEIRPVEQNTVLAAELADSTGQLTALFYGRSHIPGLDCGARVRLRGQVGIRDGGPGHDQPRL